MKTKLMKKLLFSFIAGLVLLFSLNAQTLYVPGGISGISNSPNGNVGVGAVTPQSKLHINTAAPDNIGLTIQGNTINSDNTFHYVGLSLDGDYGNGSGNSSQIRSYSNLYSSWGSSLAFYTTATSGNNLLERMRITYNGYIGIGTTTPHSALQIRASASYGSLRISPENDNEESSMGFFNDAAATATNTAWVLGQGCWGNTGKFIIGNQANGGAILAISESGNLGIGTTNPTYSLQVAGTGIRLTTDAAEFGSASISTVYGTYPYEGTLLFKTEHFNGSSYDGHIERMRIDAHTGNVGIGTTNPVAKLDIASGSLTYETPVIYQLWSTINSEYNLRLETLWTGAGINQNIIQKYNGTNYNVLSFFGGNVLIGKTTQDNATYKLDVAGKVRANEVVVNTTGADFVFDSEYKLPDLPEVEKYINDNKHLPDLAPASEMKENGMNVSEMQTKLLQKLEEMTLYIIEQNKTNELQSKEIELLKKEIELFKTKNK
jgi:hypothetical protein